MAIKESDKEELVGWSKFMRDMWKELDDTVVKECVKLMQSAYHWGYEQGFEKGYIKGQLEDDND